MKAIKNKLLFVNGSMNVGGVERSLLDLLSHLDYNIFDVDLLLLNGGGAYINYLPHQINVICHDSSHIYGPLFPTLVNNLLCLRWNDVLFRLLLTLQPYFGGGVLTSFRFILKLHKRYDCAVAYRQGLSNDIVAYAVKANKKLSWWHHGECNYNNLQMKHIRQSWQNIDAVIAVSEGCRQMIIQSFNLSNKRLFVIPNIIDIESIERQAGNDCPYPADGYIHLVTMGRFCPEKHIEEIPHIARLLQIHGIRKYRWYIIGDGHLHKKIAEQINYYQMNDQIILTGRLTNPYPYIKYADLMVHTSHVEAQCLTLLEAMALGTPCVATRTVIPQDFTIDEVNCLLAEQEPKSQMECIIRLLNNPIARESIIAKAQAMVRQKYSLQAINTQAIFCQ